jgi:ATP-dependent DNA ligase
MSSAPDKRIPFPPMEAELVRELPEGEGWQYEPKWDGFRGVLENFHELALWSRNGRPLLRYFPELRPLGELLPPRSALDGEIVIVRDGALDFDAMQMRLHPAESRIRRLSAEIPAQYVVFDILFWDGEPVWKRPLEERRRHLEQAPPPGIRLSPTTRDVAEARGWLDAFEAIGLDGVVAKRLALPYLPGSRDGVLKVKEHKTADCVVVGVRWKGEKQADARAEPARPRGGADKRYLGKAIATLLLGLYCDDGGLDYVGSCAVAASSRGEVAARVLPLVEEDPDWHVSEPNRWGTGELEEARVRPELVVEVRYDKVQGNRFRHGTKLIRWRDDKEPRDCTWRELRPARDPKAASVEALLAPASRSAAAGSPRAATSRASGRRPRRRGPASSAP